MILTVLPLWSVLEDERNIVSFFFLFFFFFTLLLRECNWCLEGLIIFRLSFVFRVTGFVLPFKERVKSQGLCYIWERKWEGGPGFAAFSWSLRRMWKSWKRIFFFFYMVNALTNFIYYYYYYFRNFLP